MQSPIFSCLSLSLFLLVQIFTSALHALVSLSRRDLNQMEVLLFAIMCCLHICDNQTDAFEWCLRGAECTKWIKLDPVLTPGGHQTKVERVLKKCCLLWRIAGGQKDRKRATEELCFECRNEHSIFLKIIWWSSVSNAAERSRNATTDVILLSTLKRRLSETASSAGSILCPFLCSDW